MASTNRVVKLAAWVPLLAIGPAALSGQPASGATPTTAAVVPAAKASTKPLPVTIAGGYRLQNIQGEMAYCRTVVPTGTTLPKRQCLTPEAIAEMEKLGQRQRDGMLQHLSVCAAATAACVSN
jgi:hypothetical protein